MVKQYFRYFRWVFIVVGVLVLIYGLVLIQRTITKAGERKNTECLTQERVFDDADVLTDEEEEKLRVLIAKKEKQVECDIVLVTLNESLEEYATEIVPGIPYNEFVKVYAEEFYDENGFGYDKAIGDGIVLLDNWFREEDGKVHTWICTTGKAKEVLGSAGIEYLLDEVYEYIEENPYKAYEAYVNGFGYRMARAKNISSLLPRQTPLIIAIVSMLVFIFIHWGKNKGKKTTVATTYVNGGRPKMKKNEDVFINKTVSKRHIQRSSGGSGSSGGGGGGGHGGGGRSR